MSKSDPSKDPWEQLSDEDHEQAWNICLRAMENLAFDLTGMGIDEEHADALVESWPQPRRRSS